MLGIMTIQLRITLGNKKVMNSFSQIKVRINKEFPQFVKIFLDSG